MKHFFTLLVLVFVTYSGFGQFVISPLSENPTIIKKHADGEVKAYSFEKSDDPIHLPFIDDFSKNHQPGATVVLWEDNHVFINPTYGVNPPTIGVATFDGLDSTGYPYNFEVSNSYGDADKLTSCSINLSQDINGNPYSASDSIYLSFYYQPRGLGDKPESEDSLVVEFYDSETDSWTIQWDREGQDLADFELVYIPILDDIYFSPDFKFRFRNKATLSGNLDHWHIDFVWLDKNRSTSEVGIPDVAFQFPVNQMLENYTSIPYSHYQINADNYMEDIVLARLVNNNSVAVNLSNVSMINYSEGSVVNTEVYPGTIDNFPAQSSASFGIPVNSYVFDPDLDETFVSFNNQFTMTSGTFDLIEDNDTIEYVQQLRNYYSYDDGSAEAGVSTNQSGGKTVVRYSTIVGDSLIGLSIYFNPITHEPVYPFFNVVYDENSNGEPGDLIHMDIDYSYVNFVQEGHDIFSYYWLDEPVYVSGAFFVGVSQTSDDLLNIGMDWNIDSHDKVFFNYGSGWWPLTESYPGSVMIRPVFQSDMDSVIMGIQDFAALNLKVYPNPVNDQLIIENDDDYPVDFEIIGMDGRMYIRDSFIGSTRVSTLDLSEGMYILRLLGKKGELQTEKIVVKH